MIMYDQYDCDPMCEKQLASELTRLYIYMYTDLEF